MDHRLCVFSVFGDTAWSPHGAARDEDARSYNHHATHRRGRAVGEAACRGLSPRSPGFDCTQFYVRFVFDPGEGFASSIARSSAMYSTNERSSFIHHEQCQELTEGVVKRQA